MPDTPLEKQLMRLLHRNARLSFEELGERLNMAPTEVAAIIDRWEAAKTILGYHAVVREEALEGNKVRAMIEVSVEPERDTGFDGVARSISKYPEVTDLLLVSGNYDLLLFIIGDTLQDVANFVASKLSTLKGVRSTRTHFMLKKYKESGFQLEDNEKHERLSITP